MAPEDRFPIRAVRLGRDLGWPGSGWTFARRRSQDLHVEEPLVLLALLELHDLADDGLAFFHGAELAELDGVVALADDVVAVPALRLAVHEHDVLAAGGL